MNCPNCNATKHKALKGGFYECLGCGALHGTGYLGDSYGLVKPYLTDADPEMKRSRYFDFTTLGSEVGRRHGWFDPKTRLITQIG